MILLAPVLYMIKDGVAEKLEEFTKRGGTFITSFFSGYVDERDLVMTGGYPGKLRNLCGLWVEETDALLPGQENGFVVRTGPLAGVYPAVMLCDIIHPETAETIAVYEKDFYAQTPAVCCNNFGKGKAWYMGASTPKNNSIFLEKFLLLITGELGIESVIPPQEGLEAVVRSKDGSDYVFLLNHSAKSLFISIPYRCLNLLNGTCFEKDQIVEIEQNGVIILEVK
ncbi:MAG TPA: beta-galactosidase trimerization domain-containing protein [Treponemataceae bacterium]|nr:beta-galactosidase trimerization domain-containing protein [Treponemataceae bacterium]